MLSHQELSWNPGIDQRPSVSFICMMPLLISWPSVVASTFEALGGCMKLEREDRVAASKLRHVLLYD